MCVPEMARTKKQARREAQKPVQPFVEGGEGMRMAKNRFLDHRTEKPALKQMGEMRTTRVSYMWPCV